MTESFVEIRLTQAEAVVLDCLLRRFSLTDRLTVEDQSEQQVLWNLQCLFEKAGDSNWPPVEQARAALRSNAE